MSASTGQSVTWWLAKFGKLLLLLAGLTIVLDLVGHERLQRFHDRANRRHRLLNELRTLYEHTDIIDQLATTIRGPGIYRGITAKYPYLSRYHHSTSTPEAIPPLFSLADVESFVTRTRDLLRREFAGAGEDNAEISIEEAILVELEARREVARRLGLSKDAQSVLWVKDRKYSRRRYPTYRLLHVVMFLVSVGAVVVFLAMKNAWSFVAFPVLLASYKFLLETQEDLTRIRIDSAVNAVFARQVSAWGLAFLGRQGDGKPAKWTALAMFIAGALMDLIWG